MGEPTDTSLSFEALPINPEQLRVAREQSAREQFDDSMFEQQAPNPSLGRGAVSYATSQQPPVETPRSYTAVAPQKLEVPDSPTSEVVRLGLNIRAMRSSYDKAA